MGDSNLGSHSVQDRILLLQNLKMLGIYGGITGDPQSDSEHTSTHLGRRICAARPQNPEPLALNVQTTCQPRLASGGFSASAGYAYDFGEGHAVLNVDTPQGDMARDCAHGLGVWD